MTRSHSGIPDTSKTAPAPASAPPIAELDEGQIFTWALTDHCCSVCFSRVLKRETFDRRKIYRCAGCGIEREGKSEAAICSCGIKLKTGVDAGIRCIRAEAPTPEFPAEITAAAAEVKPRI